MQRNRERYKTFIEDTYYHVYNRGVEKRIIFDDDRDREVFLNLLKRYVSPDVARDPLGRPYNNYAQDVELLAYCLMPNHFHLLFYLRHTDGIKLLMHDVSTAYSRYYNDKHDRVGPLFQSRYKASAILDESYLLHISRYIHLNPHNWRESTWSSLSYWLGRQRAKWIHPERLLDATPQSYLHFMKDYEDHKMMLDTINASLAVSEPYSEK